MNVSRKEGGRPSNKPISMDLRRSSRERALTSESEGKERRRRGKGEIKNVGKGTDYQLKANA